MKIRETVADLAHALDLPPEAVSGALRVTVSGQRQVMVEYHRGLLGYTREVIDVNGGPVRLRILGSDLELRAMDRETLIVSGYIAALEYE